MTRDDLIEAMAKEVLTPQMASVLRALVRAQSAMDDDFLRGWLAKHVLPNALAALCDRIPGLLDVIDGRAMVVSVEALRTAASDCRHACLVPPDGGAPTDEEAAVADRCAQIVMGLAAGRYRSVK